MAKDRISVEEWLDSPELLEVNYTKFNDKLEIIETLLSGIITQTTSPRTINTALLDRVSTEVFIETITNLNLMEKDEDDLDGYDLLCYEDKLSDLLSIPDIRLEYDRFSDLLNKRVADFYNYENNIATSLNNIKKEFNEYANSGLEYLTELINSIDAEKVASYIEKLIPTGSGEQ